MTASAPSAAPSRGLHLGLWVVQVLLALAFVMIGGMKLFSPIEKLAEGGMTWATQMPWLPRFIGLSELLGGLGLILPAATRIQPRLTGIAAACLTLVMVLAVGYHVVFDGGAHVGGALVFGLLTAFVTWGRLVKAPIAPKS